MTGPRKAVSASGLRNITIAMLVCGVAAAVLLVTQYNPEPPEHSALVAVLLGVGLVALHARPRRIVVGREYVESIQLDEVLFVPTLLLISPWQSVAVTAVGSLAGSLIARRHWTKTIFNLGQMATATVLAVSVMAMLNVEPLSQPTMPDALVGMLGAFVLTVTTGILVRAIISHTSGASFLQLVKELKQRVLPWSGALTLGGIGAICVGAQPGSVILVIGVVIFVHRAYAATLIEMRARQQSEQLQQAIVSMRTRVDPESVRTDVIASARDLLGAEVADIVDDSSPEPAHAYSAPLAEGQRLRVDQRRGGDQWDARDRATLLTLAGVAGDVLRSAEVIARLRTITNSQSEGVIALDMRTRITFANPAAVHMLGCNDDSELLGHHTSDKLDLRQRRVPIDFASMVQSQAVAHDADATLGPADVDTLDIAFSITPLRAEGEHVGAVLVLRDVTERRAFQDELTRRALHDELTGLPNRRLLLERLDHALARTSSTGRNHGLLFLDLDRFKLVNDSYGHLVGDKLLVQVGERLIGGLSKADSVARMSGDEFVVLVEDVDEMEGVTEVAERLLQLLQEPFDVDGHHIFMSASIGVGLTQDAQGGEQVLAAIDAATYAAKAAGRNCYRVSSDASVDAARARLDLEVSLRHGLDDDELELHYQPIVTTETGDVVGVEALVRWRSPQRGILWPGQFVPVAEETGLIIPLGQWVLEQACHDLQDWTRQHPDRPALTVSVNLSALQFSQNRLAEDVAETLRSSGLAASQLCLEITETVLMSDTASTQATLESLHQLGVSVAIDDFGTGYSSLSYLKRFSIDVVKLDRAFIVGLVTDPVDAAIASAVIHLSDALNIRTVAEGVETDDQRQMLVELGCPLIQGYLTARPLPAHDFLAFWNHRFADSPADVVDLHLGL